MCLSVVRVGVIRVIRRLAITVYIQRVLISDNNCCHCISYQLIGLQPLTLSLLQLFAVTPNQIERLYSRFTSLDRNDCGTLSREDLMRIPELAINPLCERIVHSFFAESSDDRVNFRQFMNVLAHFRPLRDNKQSKLNSREEKLKFAFKMYDLDDDGVISRDELLSILHMMVGANISQDQLVSIAERTILEADLCCQGKISFEDFCKALERTDVDQKMSIRFLN